MIHTERMSDVFTKHHLRLGKFPITLHHFTGPDLGDPHDHPYGFWTTILAGGYSEFLWSLCGAEWKYYYEKRLPGETFYVPAESIHSIIHLPAGECVTSVRWDDKRPRREPRFWRFDEHGKAKSRQWNSEEWEEQE